MSSHSLSALTVAATLSVTLLSGCPAANPANPTPGTTSSGKPANMPGGIPSGTTRKASDAATATPT
ncbi:MAG: hypothetical protein H7338_12030, partial [Candidatus Sericytochromatia bacterium]|nr:hypothetical protein [Candidatus Sericytochromatia bacterium]